MKGTPNAPNTATKSFTRNKQPALNPSLSTNMVVDWSDKLKHMEIKDVMDIDIGQMREELNPVSSQGTYSIGANRK